VDCNGADLSNQTILSTNFTGSQPGERQLRSSTVFYGNFRKAQMNSANLKGFHGQRGHGPGQHGECQARRANLTGAFLFGVDASYVDFDLAILTDAAFPHAVLKVRRSCLPVPKRRTGRRQPHEWPTCV
jgi:uncharacterized protein YjbI with pentapeptide repeats